MPHYRVTVVNRETGASEPDVTVEAATKDEAIRRASAGDRLLVESVTELSPLDELADNRGAGVPGKPPPRRRRPPSEPKTPQYFWLNFWGAIYTLIGLVILFVCAAFIIYIIIVGFAAGDADETLRSLPSMMWLYWWVFLVAASFLACGQLIYAFRDMARNSWKVHRIVRLLETRA